MDKRRRDTLTIAKQGGEKRKERKNELNFSKERQRERLGCHDQRAIAPIVQNIARAR